jgi:hypothetical protein
MAERERKTVYYRNGVVIKYEGARVVFHNDNFASVPNTSMVTYSSGDHGIKMSEVVQITEGWR